MTPRSFYLCDGDGAGWAVDEDRRLTLQALEAIAPRVDHPREAAVIHACWWRPLAEIPLSEIDGKPVVCHMTGDPARCMGEPEFLSAFNRVTMWIAQSRSALERLRTIQAPVAYAPYAVDSALFSSPGQDSPLTASTRRRIPAGSYVIANFHRDTQGFSGTPKEYQPKLVKGPDVFVTILAELRRLGEPVVALLAGPRRHWVRSQLNAKNIPSVFVGEETPRDDYPRNILDSGQIAQLYGLADLCLITSRSEGGPRAVLESAAAGIATLSTPVGHAPDILCNECLFGDAAEAVEKIREDIRHRSLRRYAPAHRAIVAARHSVESVREHLTQVYRSLPASVSRSRVRVPARPTSTPVVSFWNKFTPPPWGGGNQFMMALMAQAQRRGITCTQNGEGPRANAHIVNSIQFDIDKFESMVEPGSCRVLHRIDGPISLIRGTPESLDSDRRCFDFNSRFATATIIQSWHTMHALAQLGLRPTRPALIINACDPAMFHRAETPRVPGERLRIVATSWSPNPGKGAAVYQWLDENLDPNRYEFTFVGNCPTTLKHTRIIAPLPSAALAEELRRHDVYLTASRNDPCSNALIEALSCGLPALYLNSGGHPELVSFGGLPFSHPHEIPALLERIRSHYPVYSSLAVPESIADVCDRYLAFLLSDGPYRE